MATISSPGIGSNLDVNGIVAKLMSVDSQPLTVLQKKEASYQAKLSAYGTLKGALSSFQNAVTSLASPSTFQTLNAISSDSSVFTASASSSAVAGNYSVSVGTLAQAQSLSSAAQSSTTSSIGTGTSTTLTFQFGTISGGTLTNGVYAGASFSQDATQATGTVVIDSTNNSLQGIRDAINAAHIGVTASIVNDGNATSPYHLVLASSNTGLSKSMKITSSGGDASITNLLGYDPTGTQNLTQATAAQNASLTVNGISITSASNTVTDAISGVTLNLAKANSSANLALSNNTSAVTTAVIGFVGAYNDLNSTLDKLTSYDATTKTGGLLLGDSATQAIQTRLRSTLGAALSGLGNNTITNLSQIGVAYQKDGSLTVDNAKLQSALSSNFGDFAQLFSAYGKTTDSLVSYVSSGSNSQPGSYAVSVTSLATQGNVAGSNKATQARQTGSVAANTTITAGVNDTITLPVDGGAPITATLTAGSYTAATLAAEVQTQINNALTTAGQSSRVTVTESSGTISLTSNSFGSASSIGSVTGNGATDLLGGAPTNSTVAIIKTGVNDQLTMTLNGVTATVTLAAGTYTSDTLAAQIQAAVNGTPAFSLSGASVSVKQSGDVLTITSSKYGSSSAVSVSGGNGITNLFGSAPTATAGLDVAGTINGIAARGSGQSLIGTTGLQGKVAGSDKGTQAQRIGSAAAGLTITAGVNDTITLAVDGAAPITATLTAGSYTSDTLAAEVQTQINNALTTAGQSGQVTVGQSGGIISITSNTFGAASAVGGVSGNGVSNLLGATQTNSTVTTISTGVNDQLTLSVDGVTATVTLAAGTYSASALASQIQSAINTKDTFSTAGKSVSVTQSGDVFTITSNGSGTGSTVHISGGSASTNIFGAAPTETAGSASSNSAGDLNVQILGGSAGSRGTLNYSRGYGYNLSQLLDSFLSSTGPIASSTDSANKSIADLQKQADELNVRLTATEKHYRAQFTALDQLVGQMTTTSSFLTQQLASLSKLSSQ
ncbi:MAG TPA: flagellar filament capping protein FliD [Noviherbaspirillum sp.]|uniref:flagellar filament capping protein FliD n=1 Tax=Noviherbaspirillum sp. TaxID=1926288 RepID=UPI002B4881D4|nr:flagellar filament capping protein FliD [Noviherbaspirillum sp.]HJV88521.1 flagellar filament capping protein FliD [Noviherbaspirillum sp.]